MKKILLPLLLMVSIGNAYCQHLHFIKFMDEWDQTHPTGPLIISVEKLIVPTDRDDRLYGHSFKTDINTFNCIRDFIRKSKYTVLYNLRTSGRFKIVCSDGKIYYIYGRNASIFTHQLQAILESKNADKRLIFFLQFY